MKSRKQTQPRFRANPNMTRRTFNGHEVGWFYEECYQENIYLLWNITNEQLAKYLAHHFTKDAGEISTSWAGYCYHLRGKSCSAQVICVANWTGSNIHHSYLAHECFHAAHNILECRGELLTDDHSEPYAYLMQSIYNRCLQIITNKPV